MSGESLLNIVGGFVAKKAAARESKALKKQGNVAAEEGEREAQRQEAAGSRLQVTQSQGLLKSGVSLEGSSLLVLQDTAAQTAAQASATREAGIAQRNLARDRAKNIRIRGRAAVLSASAAAVGASEGRAPGKTATPKATKTGSTAKSSGKQIK